MNPLQWLARSPTAYRILVPAGGSAVEAADALLRFLTGGRIGVLDVAGLPGMRITVSGRKTGLARTATLLYTPVEGGLVVVGSNWGRRHHPAWSANLQSAQHVGVRRRGRVCTARVRLLTGDERARAWAAALEHWPNYRIAEDRSGGREFRIFLLTPSASLSAIRDGRAREGRRPPAAARLGTFSETLPRSRRPAFGEVSRRDDRGRPRSWWATSS